MNVIQKIKRKELMSVIMMFIFLMIFLFLVIMLDGYKISFKEYVKGFKTSYISNELDIKNITLYNTTVLKSKEVYSTDYTFEKVSGRTRKTLTLYIAMIEEQPVYIIKNLKKIKKEGENFVFKGRLKNYDPDFVKIYTELPSELMMKPGVAIVYLDTANEWKFQTIFQLMIGYILVPFLAYLFIKKIIKCTDYRKSGSYENLMIYGNPEEIIKIIENEEIIEKSRTTLLTITKNWYIVPKLTSLSFVPKDMIIGFSLYVHSGKAYNSIHLYLIDGTIEVIQVWKKTSMRVIELLKTMAIHLDYLDKNTYKKVKELHDESREAWKAYESENNSIYNDLKNGEDNNIPNRIRKQFLELTD